MWWWLAAAYGISFVADTVALVTRQADLVSMLYPVSQAGIIGAVLLPRLQARWFLTVVVGAGLLGVVAHPVVPDVVLDTVAWGGIATLAWWAPSLGLLRWALLLGFGGGALAWIAYTTDPWGPWWHVYQACRAMGTGLFCWAAWTPVRLRLI